MGGYDEEEAMSACLSIGVGSVVPLGCFLEDVWSASGHSAEIWVCHARCMLYDVCCTLYAIRCMLYGTVH